MADDLTPAQRQQLINQWNETWKPLREGFAALGDALTQAFATIQPGLESFWRVWRDEIVPRVHQAYLDAGAPYGDTHDGLMRWLRDESEVLRHQQQIDHIRQRQQMVADFRRALEHRHRRRQGEQGLHG